MLRRSWWDQPATAGVRAGAQASRSLRKRKLEASEPNASEEPKRRSRSRYRQLPTPSEITSPVIVGPRASRAKHPDDPEADQGPQCRENARSAEGADPEHHPDLRVGKEVVQCDAHRPCERCTFDPETRNEHQVEGDVRGQ